MASSLDNCNGKSSRKRTSRSKLPAIVESLLRELLPESGLQLASSLADDEKEVLVFLVIFSGDPSLASRLSILTGNSPWRPWKISSLKGGNQKEVCPSCSFSAAFAASFLPPGEHPAKKSSSSTSISNEASICDCFSMYSRMWSRWDDSPNSDVINDILDLIENLPQNVLEGTKGKKKKKKRLDKKHVAQNEGKKDQCSVPENVSIEDADDFRTSENGHNEVLHEDPRVSVAGEHLPPAISEKSTTRRRKGLFSGLKQKQKTRQNLSMTSRSSERIENELSLPDISAGGCDVETGTVEIELPENLTSQSSTGGVMSSASSASPPKVLSKPQQHTRLGKLKKNKQILPLDCEGIEGELTEQEVLGELHENHAPMSPRPPDSGVGARGLLARVFPDAMGRLASRLWDLVSVRPHTRTVEYW